MGGIGRALGGALMGFGEGLEKQTLANMQERQAIALENLRASNQSAAQATQYDLADRNASRDDARGAANKAVETAQTFKQTVTLKNIDFSNTTKLEGLKHKYNLAEGAADDARTLDHDLKLNGVTADHWEVTTGGRLVAYNKNGEILGQSSPGRFVPSRTSVSDNGDEGGTISDAIAARGGPEAAAPAPVSEPPRAQTKPTGQRGGANPQKAQALARLGGIYAEAASNPQKAAQYRRTYPGMFNADGTLKPRQDVISMFNAQFGG